MFQSLDIQNFRGFSKLALGDLGRVNLIVGKNNTGKTSLLEAITLLADPAQLGILPELFRSSSGSAVEMFYRWLPKDGSKDGETRLLATTAGAEPRNLLLEKTAGKPAWPAEWPEGMSSTARGGIQPWIVKGATSLNLRAVSVQHKAPDAMVDGFAEAVRSPRDEEQMESLLASVDPRIRTVRLDSVNSKPFIVVDVGLGTRVPLSQAGQGIYRLVAIFSDLLGHKPKICCIDEIENGIHYSALPSVWRGIAEVAARLDIQVFATTHSWECLLAAHEVFASRDAYDLRVVQLYRLGEAIEGRVLDRDHIEAAIAGEIELR